MMRAAEDIRAGDVIVFLSQPHLVQKVEPYYGANQALGAFGIARSSDGWGITLFAGQLVEVADREEQGDDDEPSEAGLERIAERVGVPFWMQV